MATTTNIPVLKINYLSQAQYDAALANNEISSNELYFTPSGSNTNTDTKVTQTATTVTGGYPILFSKQSATRAQWSDVTDSAYVDPAIAINPNNSKITIRTTNYNDGIDGSGFYTYDVDNSKYMASLCSSIQGTTSTVGRAILMLGNNTASGTAGNAKGRIYLYGESTGWAGIDTAVGTTNRLYTIPDAGTSADFVMTAGDQTIGGTKTFSGNIKFSDYSSGIIDNSANAKFNTLHIYKNISGDYTTTVNTTTSVQQNSIFNAKPTAAGVTNQIVFVI